MRKTRTKLFWGVSCIFTSRHVSDICLDVLNTLLEHDLDDLPANRQPDEEDEEEEDELDEEEEDEEDIGGVEEMDGEEEPEDKDDEENGVEPPSLSMMPLGCSSTHRASTFSTISTLSTASKDSMFSTLSVTSGSYSPSLYSVMSGADSDFFEDSDDCTSPCADKSSPKSGSRASARLSQHLYRLFMKPKSPRSLSRAKSLGNPESKELLIVREKRSNSLPQQVKLRSPEAAARPQSHTLRHVCFRRRPILSSDEDSKSATLRVVVFGADHVAGKVARAYNSLRRKESACPRLSRVFRLQFYFVPVKRDSAGVPASFGSPAAAVAAAAAAATAAAVVQTGALKGTTLSNVSVYVCEYICMYVLQKQARSDQFHWRLLLCCSSQGIHTMTSGDSTNDIAHLLGMLDPWYERNTLSLLNLPPNVVCQVQFDYTA